MQHILNRLSSASPERKVHKELTVFLHFSYIYDAVRLGHMRKQKIHRRDAMKETCLQHEPEFDDIESIDLPPMHPAARIYSIISTIFHLINLVQSLVCLVMLRQDFRDFTLILCYTPRFYATYFLGYEYMLCFGILVSSLHLIWRLMTWQIIQYCDLDVVKFLFSSIEHLRRNMDQRRALEYYRETRLFCTLIEEAIFCPIETDGETRLFKRPNRTMAARGMLVKLVDVCFKSSLACSLILFILIALPQHVVTTIHHQDDYYPGCAPNPSIPTHYLRAVLSFINLTIMAGDSFAACFYPASVASILISDLLIYWRDIERRISHLRTVTEEYKRLLDNWVQDTNNDLSVKNSIAWQYYLKCNLLELAAESKKPREQTDMSWPHSSFAEEIRFVQALICDFFGKLDRADGFVGILMGFALYSWLLINATITFLGLQVGRGNKYVRVMQLLYIAVILLLSFVIVAMKKRTERAYLRMSSLMAEDPTLDKGRWATILKFYTVGSRHGFTIFRAKLYSLPLFFKYFSYTFVFMTYAQQFKIIR